MKYILILLLLFSNASFGQITANLNSTSNPIYDAFFKDFQEQTWKISIDSSGELILQKSAMMNTEYIGYKTLYFASITPNTTGGFTTGGFSTTYESLKRFNGSGSATFKYNPANPNLAGTKIGVAMNAGTQFISMEYVYEAGIPKFKFFTNTSYGSLAEITGATVDITKFYRWVRIGNIVGIYSDVSETGTFATLVRAFPEAYSGTSTFISGYIEKPGDGLLFGRFRSLNPVANPEILRFISSTSITKQIQKNIRDSTAQYMIGKGLNYDIPTLTLKLKVNTPIGLADAATTTWDNNASNVATWTMAGSRTLSISNDANGEKGTLLVTQDGTGGRIITFPTGDNLTGITQTTTANSNTMYTYIKIGGVRYWTASLK